MAELRPYQPGWRDQLGQLLMGNERASPVRRRFVSGLLGSAGLGQTGMSLVDLTPLAAPLSANEAYRDYQDGNYTGAALNTLGTVLGAAPALAVLGKGAKNLASRSVSLYDPPVKPPRPFAADYPAGAPADARGKLTHTIDGDPITARYVVGRTEGGGGDVALPGEALDEIAKAGTGEGIRVLPQSALGRDVGRAVFRPDGTPKEIAISSKLTPGQSSKVAAHEVGHLIDQMASEIPTAGLSRELTPLYDALNTGRERASNFMRPQNLKYTGDDIPREYMAEAIRAYMADPNYLKTVAPKTAARIREHVNANPKLNRTVQFNSIAAPVAGVAAGGAVLAGSDDAKASPMASEPPPGAVLSDEPPADTGSGPLVVTVAPNRGQGNGLRTLNNVLAGGDGLRSAAPGGGALARLGQNALSQRELDAVDEPTRQRSPLYAQGAAPMEPASMLGSQAILGLGASTLLRPRPVRPDESLEEQLLRVLREGGA
ncbi:hypothetical protein [Bosea sp. 685]|uniref:hypothetical protein n=1 Tax=Bosea sp. 685 TaxID=3080057 RepID=UPI002892FBD3|nr:hypothetical protein [Bosea sp. 685]WNJ88460.1 hypothetical protein RMR04_18820 [Bosea sp. 685]